MRMRNLSMCGGGDVKTPPHFRMAGFSSHGEVLHVQTSYAIAAVVAVGVGLVGSGPDSPFPPWPRPSLAPSCAPFG